MIRARSRSDIDIEKLRKKYSRPRADLQAEASRDVRRDVLSSSEQKMTEVTMCQACQAHGTVQRQYGFRVLTEVCDQCNGEGCFIKGQGKLASMELKEKVAKVEELIAACEDIDELEELETALKDKTMVKLDAVLKEDDPRARGRARGRGGGEGRRGGDVDCPELQRLARACRDLVRDACWDGPRVVGGRGRTAFSILSFNLRLSEVLPHPRWNTGREYEGSLRD